MIGHVVGGRGLVIACGLLAGGGLCLFLADLASLGLLALAGVAGLLATHGLLRRVVGGVLGAAGIVAATVGWLGVGVIGGVLVLLAGLSAVVAGARWPTLGARYAGQRARDPWTALDHGDDPTV